MTTKTSKTGTYKWNPQTKQMEKVSDAIPNTQVFDCHVPTGGYWSHNLGHNPIFVRSRSHKRRLMAKAGLTENPKTQLGKREL